MTSARHEISISLEVMKPHELALIAVIARMGYAYWLLKETVGEERAAQMLEAAHANVDGFEALMRDQRLTAS